MIDTLLVIAVLGGAFCATFLVVRSPDFWFGLGAAAIKAALPTLTKPMSPEDQKRFQDCVRRGGEWNHVTRRCK